MPVEIPCGQCIGCRLERSRQWALRCVHEASLYNNNCFLTLTYNNENLPADKSLNVKHFQDFMKRLRKAYSPKKIRFFHCGEYGAKNQRPHYHAIIFNHDFDDKILFRNSNGVQLYTSSSLDKLWPFGFSTIGSVTFESAAYVARYITKKVTGELATEHYKLVDTSTGEIHNLKPEYITMSRRPGVGREWYDKYKTDVYPKDFTTLRGIKLKPPKFYDNILEKEHEEEYLQVKKKRIRNSKKRRADNTPERLNTKETIKKIKFKNLLRPLEHEE